MPFSPEGQELAMKALNIIKENPEHWKQNTWHCGSSHCFLGHIHLLHRGLPPNYNGFLNDTLEKATELLGVTNEEAEELALWTNSLEDLERICDRLKNSDSLSQAAKDGSSP